MPLPCSSRPRPLFDPDPINPPVPTANIPVDACCGAPGRQAGGRADALPFAVRDTAARSLRIMTVGGVVAFALSLPMSIHSVALAQDQSLENGEETLPTTADPFAEYVAEASQRFDVPALRIRVVMRAESGRDVHALSAKGAMGLMQIMPETWAELRDRYALGIDPYDPHDNILAGAAYMQELHDRFGAPGFLAAYNAGPARYEEYLDTGLPLPDETLAYVKTLGPVMLAGQLASAALVPPSPEVAPIFVSSANTIDASEMRSSAAPASRLTPEEERRLARFSDVFVARDQPPALQGDGVFGAPGGTPTGSEVRSPDAPSVASAGEFDSLFAHGFDSGRSQ